MGCHPRIIGCVHGAEGSTEEEGGHFNYPQIWYIIHCWGLLGLRPWLWCSMGPKIRRRSIRKIGLKYEYSGVSAGVAAAQLSNSGLC